MSTDTSVFSFAGQGSPGSEQTTQHLPPERGEVSLSFAAKPRERLGVGGEEGVLLENTEALEVQVFWGETVLDHAHLYEVERVTLGESRKNTFSLSCEELPFEGFPLVETQGEEMWVQVAWAMEGVLLLEGKEIPLEQVRQSARSRETRWGFSFPLPVSGRVQLRLGEFLFSLGAVPVPQRLGSARLLAGIDYHYARSVGASFLFHGMLALLMLFTSEEPRQLRDEFIRPSNRFAQLIVRPEEPPKKPKKEESGRARAPGKEGKMGEKDAPKKRRRAGQKERNLHGTSPIDLVKTRKALQNKLMKRGILGLLGGGHRGGVGAMLTAKGIGGDDATALGGWHGAKVGAAQGSGFGLRGSGSGGGCVGFACGRSVGLDQVGVFGGEGRGRARRWARTRLKENKERTIVVEERPPVVVGSLDREIIRRVINQHRHQIKYCYEKELNKNKSLRGKIKVFFQIEGTGKVSVARVAQTTMNNDRVEDCIVRRVRYWRFPAPTGGGIVQVNYPFFFKPSGSSSSR